MKVQSKLECADWSAKRELIRALVKRIEINQQDVNVVFRISPPDLLDVPQGGGYECLQHCEGRNQPNFIESISALCVRQMNAAQPLGQTF
ncbi:Site-specific recombinase, DNA invertase Pin [Mycoavidus cysteinexigens]|uniref:Site-specific recombinase, DNA invertase Pin n=1 Tax=Mycoavidus cysteinexigens TaxID=1553431 RepID=A0A2Z6ERY7_9BURK|nr:hypothetical protein [Mycoavidus cysteinexigens]BBE08165.1 Site-specific recombinase, DNA invertase Pin [Mycoavidus cysteinexigens]GLR01844.1 hypothetical protein GCM10007934_16560 [Mycoavidus cysteinexigens]